ncbi:MAG: BamA/TamA family outer membrane protein [Saprospirales bacterium]|nr:BamA/TamA family outer membrane protein [Saprospirales bacterium]MBK8920086.1 BamA/TamA family outer membrane protein [Saprospirales bacterium]
MRFHVRHIQLCKKSGSHPGAVALAPSVIVALAVLLSSCNVTKHLDKRQGQPLLQKNSLELKSEKPLPLDVRTPLQYELTALFRQKPNERSILAFRTPARLWFYFRYKDKKSKLAKWVMEKIAEPPALFDEDMAIRTSTNLQNYMRQRGYFKAQSAYEVRFFDTKYYYGDDLYFDPRADSLSVQSNAAVTYTLQLGPQYRIDTVKFISRDTNVLGILQATAGRSMLKTGGALDGRSFEAEKLRITAALKNRGYAFFIPNFVEFTGDSTGSRANVIAEVLMPNDSTLHQTYMIGNVAVFSDLVPNLSGIRQDTTIDGIYFATSDPRFEIRPDKLVKAIAIRPGALFRQDDFDKTAQNLNALGIFRFVSVRPVQDSIQPGIVDVAISFALNTRFSTGYDLDLNSSTNSGSDLSGRLLGVSGSVSAINRNLLHGAENIRTDLAYSLEFDLAPRRSSLIFSQEFKFQNELIIPQYFDYLHLWRRLDRWRLITSEFYEHLRNNGQVRIGLNYNYLDLRGFYVYNLFNASFGYMVRSDAEHQYSFDNIGIDILRPKLQPRFETIFGQNEFLKRSFGNQLFTGFFLRSFTYTFSSRQNAFGERWFFRLNTEVSGLEELVLNRLWAIPFGKQTWTISDLDFSKYVRLDVNGSYSREFTRDLTAIVRLGAGFATPYGDTRGVPYVKQFFVGGPSSIRAWRIRELGPGGYVQSDTSCNCPVEGVQPFYQAADFRFEFNGELRFPLFWWIKGAVFIDGGNVWTVKPDPGRPKAQLGWGSYKNIAIGTGFGLRFDFDYFVFRFDWGLRLRRPYRTETQGYWVDWTGTSWKNISNFNLAVGYPF